MASKAAQLAVELTERGASDVAGGIDRVGDSATTMGNKVEAAGKSAEKGARGIDTTAEASDELASKGSQAAGAMSGLGDLIGGPFGAAMQTGGIALQAAADSGDLLNAALENSIVSTARAKAQTVAKTVADKAQAVATRATTIAQKALNLAQRASPIGLIITGVLLLAGLFVLLYKRSDKFRAIVDKAMAVAKAGVGKVVGAFQALGPVVGKVMAFIGKIVGLYVKVYVTAFQVSVAVVKRVWEVIRGIVANVVGIIGDRIAGFRDKLTGAWDTIKQKGVDAFHALLQPVQSIIDLVEHLLDKISSIHLPHIPGNPFDRGAGSTSNTSSSSVVNLYLTVPATAGTTQAQATTQAQQIMDAIDDRLVLVGRAPVFKR